MHLAYLVRDTGVEKNALCSRRLAGIDMGHNANISIALNRGCAGHDKIQIILVILECSVTRLIYQR